MHWYVNGRLLPADEARISVRDAGLQHAVGLFETMSAYHGRVFRLDRHLSRLAGSAVALGLVRELHTQPLAEAVEQTIQHNQIDRARIRLTLTAGPAPAPGSAPGSGAQGEHTLLIQPTEPTDYDPAYFTKGVRVVIAGPMANPFDPLAGHKTLAYWSRLRTLRDAASGGGGAEAIWLNVSNHLASGAVSNLFLVKNGSLLTPFARGEEVPGALPAPVLPGVTRQTVIELAGDMGIEVIRRMLTVEELLDADEVFLTNSSWHILPVTSVEKATIGGGEAGAVTSQLREALLTLIERKSIGG